jgi:hypothetical protein
MGIRTPDLLHAMENRPVHHSPRQVTCNPLELGINSKRTVSVHVSSLRTVTSLVTSHWHGRAHAGDRSRFRVSTTHLAYPPTPPPVWHHAADTLAFIADTDLHAVQTVSHTGRMYMPTRKLPEDDNNIPYRHWQATSAKIAALLNAYQAAAAASTRTATDLDAIAVTMNTPSRILAAARAATSAAHAGTAALIAILDQPQQIQGDQVIFLPRG